MSINANTGRIRHAENQVDLLGRVEIYRPPSPAAKSLRIKTEALTVFPDARQITTLSLEPAGDPRTGTWTWSKQTLTGTARDAIVADIATDILPGAQDAQLAGAQGARTNTAVGNMTQAEIGREVGLSQMHVSRLIAQTLARGIGVGRALAALPDRSAMGRHRARRIQRSS